MWSVCKRERKKRPPFLWPFLLLLNCNNWIELNGRNTTLLFFILLFSMIPKYQFEQPDWIIFVGQTHKILCPFSISSGVFFYCLVTNHFCLYHFLHELFPETLVFHKVSTAQQSILVNTVPKGVMMSSNAQSHPPQHKTFQCCTWLFAKLPHCLMFYIQVLIHKNKSIVVQLSSCCSNHNWDCCFQCIHWDL